MGLAGVIIFLLATKIVSVQIGILMLLCQWECISDSEF